ncbi:LIM-domain binding protein-domain-containing protein [Mycena maculata]|uniref:LIM-domain binding protein-domain-containing protein n=1 Tax=Mycena maculata TaxID=230809 RepID=A0AAD7JEF8_9AGAR|nr:LIM-domain binding protein-domain-containing protein [Mycena maculata]
MSASGSYLHTEAPDFSASDLDPFMNPMLRQQVPPSMIGLNNPAFMQSQPGGPQHMGNPNGPNPPMGMLQGGPEMRFQPGHNPSMVPRSTMGMRPGVRPSMNPGGMPPMAGHPMGGMGFPPNMMPTPGMPPRRVASNPAALGGMNGQQSMMIQQQMQHHQMQQNQLRIAQQQQQQQQQHAQQQRQQQQMEMAMMRGQQPGNPQNAGVVRSGSAGPHLMNSLSQPASHNQPPHPGGMQHNAFQNPIAPPPQSASPRARTPVMNMAPGPSQPPLNRAQMSSDEMFTNFPQNQYPSRPMANGPFAFGTSPTPPLNLPEFPSTVGTPGRTGGFPPTPAQQLSMQQHGGVDGGYPFGMGGAQGPPRPLSNNQQHHAMQQHSPPQQPSQHHSPHHSDHMNSHPPRPQSQPQPQPPPGRPLSGAGPSHTPRPQQTGLPSNPGLLPPGRLPPQQAPPPQSNIRPQSSGSVSHNQPIAPRPPPPTQQQPAAPGSSDGTLMSASASPPENGAMLPNSIPRPPASSAHSIGYGQGLIRVMQFSGLLNSDTAQTQSQKLKLSYWDTLIREYFTPKAIMKLTLWRDSMKNEAKPFEIGVPILPRFFLVTTQSGVKSMSLTLDGARERVYAPGHAIVECVTAVWTYRYNNGHIVTLRGPLTAHLVICSPAPHTQVQTNGAPPYVLKFDDFEFDAHSHDKYIALDAIAGPRKAEEPVPAVNGAGDEDKKWEEPRLLIENGSIPGEPVNAFGIPQATMRCLELAESVGQMADLISFAKDQDVGPLSALKSFAEKIREDQPQLTMINGFGANPFFQSQSSAQGNTLYSSAPPSVTNPVSAQPSSSMSSPQNAPPSAHNSPQKQHKTIPAKGSVASASTPTTSTSSNTPALANSTLKRKQTDTGPNSATEPSAKRATRQRRRATGGGG